MKKQPDGVRIETENARITMPPAAGLQLQPCEIPIPGRVAPESSAMLVVHAGERERQRGFMGLAVPLARAELRRVAVQMLNLCEMAEQRDAELAQRVALVAGDGSPMKDGGV